MQSSHAPAKVKLEQCKVKCNNVCAAMSEALGTSSAEPRAEPLLGGLVAVHGMAARVGFGSPHFPGELGREYK